MTQDLFRHLRAHTSGEKNMDMKQLDARQELLVITMEECGELIEACSKAVRCEDYTIDKLTEEAGDVLCMIELMKQKGILSERELNNRIQTKKMKLMKWSNLL